MTTLKVTVDPIMRPVRAFYATDSSETHVEGICIAVLSSPSLIIRTPDGRDVAWLADLCEVTGEEVSDLPTPPALVTIDPEDRKQVERLIRLQIGSRAGRPDSLVIKPAQIDAMQAALREFANPTPAEPTDPKARVTDFRENVWRLLADGDWVCTSGPDIGEYLVWWQLAERGPLSVEGATS